MFFIIYKIHGDFPDLEMGSYIRVTLPVAVSEQPPCLTLPILFSFSAISFLEFCT